MTAAGEIDMSKKGKGAKKATKGNTDDAEVQTSLFSFGGSRDGADHSFIRMSEVVKSVGDTFTFSMDSATYNADKGCLTVFDGTGQAVSVHQHHSPAMIENAAAQGWTLPQTDADRFGPAFEKAGLLNGYTHGSSDEAWGNIASSINTQGAVLTVTMVQTKSGHNFRRWTVARTE